MSSESGPLLDLEAGARRCRVFLTRTRARQHSLTNQTAPADRQNAVRFARDLAGASDLTWQGITKAVT